MTTENKQPDERAAFEAWAREEFRDEADDPCKRGQCGYLELTVDWAWIGWQARATTQQANRDEQWRTDINRNRHEAYAESYADGKDFVTRQANKGVAVIENDRIHVSDSRVWIQCRNLTEAVKLAHDLVEGAAAPQAVTSNGGRASIVAASLTGLARHVRAVPAYAKLVGDMEMVDNAIDIINTLNVQAVTLSDEQIKQFFADLPLPAWARDIGAARLKELLAAHPTEQRPDPSDIQGWAVTVNVNAVDILTIGHNSLSGIDNISDFAEVVRNCAKHLMGFIGEDGADQRMSDAERFADLLRGWYDASTKGTVMVEDAAYRLVTETAEILYRVDCIRASARKGDSQ